MQNFVQVGEQLKIVAPANVVSGQGLLVGALFGVVTNTAASGEETVLRLEGVVTLPKATGALTLFQKVYWDDTAKKVTGTATANSLIGVATAPVASAGTLVNVRLNGTSV
jgi:predicted RecA/RadA family phage recombinase